MASELAYVRERFKLEQSGLMFIKLNGVVDGVQVHITTSADRSNQLRVTAYRPTGSDIAINVGTARLFVEGVSFESGDREFDGIFSCGCSAGNEALAQAMLDSSVRAGLLAIVQIAEATLTDFWVAAIGSNVSITGPELARVVQATIDVARAADRATEALGSPAELAGAGLESLLEDTAKREGYSFRRHPLAIAGTTEHGDHLSVFLATQGAVMPVAELLQRSVPSRGTVVRVAWAEPLFGSLTVRPASLVDRAQSMLGVGDIELGHHEFDKAFVIGVRADSADAMRELAETQLNARVRARLLQAKTYGLECALDDRQLVGRGHLPSSPEAALEILRIATEIAPAIRQRKATNPYR